MGARRLASASDAAARLPGTDRPAAGARPRSLSRRAGSLPRTGAARFPRPGGERAGDMAHHRRHPVGNAGARRGACRHPIVYRYGMSWPTLYGHEAVWAHLVALLDDDRLPHALLLTGP